MRYYAKSFKNTCPKTWEASWLLLLLDFWKLPKKSLTKKCHKKEACNHMHCYWVLASSDASFRETRQKWLFFDWRLLACDFVDFGIFKLVTLPNKSEPKQKKVKKSWGWGISFWDQNLAPEWLVVVESSATVIWLVLFALLGPKLGLVFLDIWGGQTNQIAKLRSHAQTFRGSVTKVTLFFTYWALPLK